MYFLSFISIFTLLELFAAQPTSVMSDIAYSLNVPVCYSPDGSIVGGNYACNLSANVSVCCGVGAICLDNKICQNGNDQVIRGACTDPTWQSPECPQYCLVANTGGEDLISCQNVTNNALDYCCDHTNNCCITGVGRFRLSGTGIPFMTIIGSSASTATRHLSTSTSSIPTTTAFSSTSSTSSSLAAHSPPQTTASLPSATSSPSAGLGTSAKVGIGVGVSAGMFIIAVLSLFLWWSLRTKALPKREVTPYLDAHSFGAGTHDRSQELSAEMTWEMAGDRAGELPTARQAAWELPARN